MLQNSEDAYLLQGLVFPDALLWQMPSKIDVRVDARKQLTGGPIIRTEATLFSKPQDTVTGAQ